MKLNIKKLDVKRDERGWLAEIITAKDVDHANFGLALLTTAKPGETKGGHYHLRKREWYSVIRGSGRLEIRDRKSKKIVATLEMNYKDPVLVEVPIGYFHSITNTGKIEMYLLAYVSEPFDSADPDTFYE